MSRFVYILILVLGFATTGHGCEKSHGNAAQISHDGGALLSSVAATDPEGHAEGCCDDHAPSLCRSLCCSSFVSPSVFSFTPSLSITFPFETALLEFQSVSISPQIRPPLV